MRTTREQLAASVLMVGFAGPSPDQEFRDLISLGLGGAILFRRNVVAPGQVFDLCRELKSVAQRPLLCGIDQEGGRVARLRDGFTSIPSMRTVGRTASPAVAGAIGAVIGEECRAVGLDVDFAPVLDVDTNPKNPVIGDRSFGSDPDTCAAMGTAVALGIQSRGVAACGKHLPGHGDTHQDSHHELPILRHGMERLDAVELLPFRRAVAAGLASVMTAHLKVPALDADLPVTLSPRALQAVRSRTGMDDEAGPLVISDDLEMAAIASQWDIGAAAPLAIMAGCDLLLVCRSGPRQSGAQEAIAALCKLAERPDGRRHLERAQRRVQAFAQRWARNAGSFDASHLQRPESLRLVEQLNDTPAAGTPDPTEVV
jgi:beta-N-acetylhexosaminidase